MKRLRIYSCIHLILKLGLNDSLQYFLSVGT